MFVQETLTVSFMSCHTMVVMFAIEERGDIIRMRDPAGEPAHHLIEFVLVERWVIHHFKVGVELVLEKLEQFMLVSPLSDGALHLIEDFSVDRDFV